MLSDILSLTNPDDFTYHINLVAKELNLNVETEEWKNLITLIKDTNPLYRNNKFVYHNWIHIFYSALVGYYLAVVNNEYISVKRHVFISLLLHDLGHSCGLFEEKLNIEIAKTYASYILTDYFLQKINANDIRLHFIIENIIASSDNETKFVNRTRQYIKDADLTMTLSALSNMFATGINNELNTNYYTHENMLLFAKSQRIYTQQLKILLGV